MKYLISLALILALPVSAKEFYKVNPSSDSRKIYVAEAGSDSNPCTRARPCQSIDKGLSLMRNGFPDHLYLRSGDSWESGTIKGLKGGRSAKEPMVITSYGTGPRPYVAAGKDPLMRIFRERDAMSFFVLKALRISGATLEFMGPNKNLVFDDNIFNGAGLAVHHGNMSEPKNVLISNNIFTGAHKPNTSYNEKNKPSSIYISRVENNTIRGNVFDFGGWHPTLPGRGANMYDHNLYLQYNGYGTTFEDNIVVRGANLGVHARSGGWFTENTFIENSVGIHCNYRNHTLPDPQMCSLERNVFMDGRSMYTKGVDPCEPDSSQGDKALCSGAIWGITMADPTEGLFYFRDNLVARGNHPADAGITSGLNRQGFLIQQNGRRRSLSDYPDTVDFDSSNIVYDWGTSYNVPANLPNPKRDAGDFAERVLGLDNSLDAYMTFLKNRRQGVDHYRYSAKAINDFVRAGFGMKLD